VILLQHSSTLLAKEEYNNKELFLKYPDSVFPVHELGISLQRDFVDSIGLLACLSGTETMSFAYSLGKRTFVKGAVKYGLVSEIAKLTREFKIDLFNISNYVKEKMEVAKIAKIAAYGKNPTDFNSLNDLRLHLSHRKKF
jgi:hypothetical protein